MTIEKIMKEINSRIETLEDKKHKLIVLEITRTEREKREEEIDNELDKLYKMIRG